MAKAANRDVSYTGFRRMLFTKGEIFRYIPAGGFFELPMQYFISHPTDIDIMFTLRHLYASVETNQMSNNERSGDVRLLIQTDKCHVGFARLRQPMTSSDDLDSEFYRKPKSSESQYLGPCIVKTVNATESSNCNMLPILLRLLNAVWGEKSFMKFDRAYAISCPAWPDVAKEWTTRKRTNGWPPDDVRDNVISLGCHLVSKPHQSNPTDDTQWRFSFSLAELILIQNWTHVQTYIYHILRLIKSEIVKACGGENETVLCTYFFKTLMLWACEEKPQEFWREENIETAVGELLCIMIEWLIEKRVPNYFVPGNNMIDHLSIDDDLSTEVSLLSNHRTSYLDRFVCNVPNSLLEIPIFFHLPKELIDLFSANTSFHVLFDPLANGKLNSLSESRTFLPGLRPLFDGLTLQKNITCESCEYSSNEVQMAIRYFESAMRSEDKFSPLAIDCGKSVIGNMSSYLGVFVKENCSTQLGTAEAEKDIRISTGSFGTSNLSGKNEIIINLARHLPSLTLVLTKTYYANFLYATLKDYAAAFELCRKIDTFLKESDAATIRIGSSYFTQIYIPLSNKWSSLFDIHIQAVLGFLNIFSAVRTKRNGAIVVNINVGSMIEYIRFQSARCFRPDENVEYVCNFGHAKIFSFCGVYRLDDLSKAILMAAISASGIRPTRNGQKLTAYHFLS